MSQAGVAPQLGKETHVEALGAHWIVGRWTVDVWDELLAWVRGRLPDPWAAVERLIDKLSPEQADKLIQQAQERADALVSITSPVVQAHIDSPEGKFYTFWLLLRQRHPDVTRQQAFEIALELGERKQQEIFQRSAGHLPSPGNGQAPAA